MNPPSQHGLNLVRYQLQRRREIDSPVTATVATLVPVRTELSELVRWKLAFALFVGLPVLTWLVVALLD
jgi:hypothetical protein